MSANENLMLMTIVPDGRGACPITPSPSREIRGIRLFHAISKKLTRPSHEDLNYTVDPECRSSSSDSCSSTSTNRSSRTKKEVNSRDSGFRFLSSNHISSSSSETESDTQQRTKRHSTSAESIRKVFQNLNLNTRSHSCNDAKEKRKSKKPPPKRILRQPVTYTYVKGLSGLPTQRIPKTSRIYNTTCDCSVQYMAGLNR